MFIKSDGKQIDTSSLFSTLMDNFPDMIHSVDEQGKIIFFNRRANDLLGYTENELSGMNIRQLYAPEVWETVKKGFHEIKQSGEKRVESIFACKDGTRIPVELTTLVIRDKQGAFVQTFTISRDLRKLKEMQDSMIHAGRLAAVGELAAGVVHDLNNPLASIMLASTLLKQLPSNTDLTGDASNDQMAMACNIIQESAETMEHLTTRLRDFMRGVKEQHTPVDLFDPINDALFILDYRIKNVKVQVSCPIIKSKHWTTGDRNQIEQVFLNLFANACDAMTPCDIRKLSVDIQQEIVNDKPFWRCMVSDTGEGIAPQQQEKVFKAFETTKPRGKGTGLGLSIARTILTEHNGNILLSSEPGKGTTFSVLLPVTPLPTDPVRLHIK
ncbi:MAG: PAS domain S-box protein [Kiritimatiellae bacterium]|jgi:PAS domain S-box-containing protein|nr:PAS domain S-box protein [Kiritimatiellia bacterium]